MEEGTSLEETIKGIHFIIGEYMAQLKELGIYDNSTIIILSDHGDNFDNYA